MTGQQLKNSILQLAVQGKLVPQDPTDEPASVLLARIREEKEQLIREKKIKREKNPSQIFRGDDGHFYERVRKNEPVCIDEELPFEIPETWEWARIKSIGTIIRGNGIKRSEIVGEGLPCVRYGEIYTSYQTSFTSAISKIPLDLFEKSKHFSHGDILLTLTGENKPDIAKAVTYLGNSTIAAGGDMAIWTLHRLNPLFLVYLLASPFVISQKIALATGDIIIHISAEKIGAILVPLPPLAEQNRIVAKIEELMPFVDRYDALKKQLQALNTTFPDQLKKSILQEAIQGNLVAQNPADEPASALLERIRAEREQLIKDGKIKKEKNPSTIYRGEDGHFYERIGNAEPVCINEKLPFEIPEGWEWARLGTLYNFIDYRGSTPTKISSGVPLVTAKNVKKGFIDHSIEEYISEKEYSQRQSRGISRKGDILFTTEAPLGNAALADLSTFSAGQRLITFQQYGNSVNLSNTLMVYYILSDCFQSQLSDQSTGTTVKGIKASKLKQLLLPLPPLAEQQRIVEKLEQILSLCENLTERV